MYLTKPPISQLKSGLAFSLMGLFLLISACGNVKVGEIEVNPAKNVEAGKTASVGANIENPKGKPLKITWSAERGKVKSASDTSASGIYTAPEPGPDSITLEVRSGGKLIASKVVAINVSGDIVPPPEPTQTPDILLQDISESQGTKGCNGELDGDTYHLQATSATDPGYFWVFENSKIAGMNHLIFEVKGTAHGSNPDPSISVKCVVQLKYLLPGKDHRSEERLKEVTFVPTNEFSFKSVPLRGLTNVNKVIIMLATGTGGSGDLNIDVRQPGFAKEIQAQ